ncbi:MAG: hypothetical protein JNM72_03760 [Deltaproteobacteria bacterium]|jgi:hypothetical protein|nr:hypothetical protein [Deltaproteobacteria bacterium]
MRDRLLSLHPAPLLALALPLTGCQALLSLREVVEGALEPFALQSTHIGVVPSEDQRIADALAGSEYASGVLVRTWVYDTRAGGAPGGLKPEFAGLASGGSLPMQEDPEGEGFRLDGEDGARFTPGDEVEVQVVYEEEPRWLRVVSPEAPAVAISEFHGAGEELPVSLAGQDFVRALVLVIDVETSETVWDNLPKSAEDAGPSSRGPEALEVTVPGDVFSADRLLAVGVAGADEAGPGDYAAVNTAVSGFTAARFVFQTVCTFEDPDLCDPEPVEGEEPAPQP